MRWKYIKIINNLGSWLNDSINGREPRYVVTFSCLANHHSGSTCPHRTLVKALCLDLTNQIIRQSSSDWSEWTNKCIRLDSERLNNINNVFQFSSWVHALSMACIPFLVIYIICRQTTKFNLTIISVNIYVEKYIM